MRSIVNFVLENWFYVGLAIVALYILVYLISESHRAQLKKGAILLLVVSGLGLGYSFITGKSPSTIPGDISRYLGDSQAKDETTHRYYRDPSERSSGDKLEE